MPVWAVYLILVLMDRLKPKVLLALLAVLQLTALTNAQLPVDQPPDAWAVRARAVERGSPQHQGHLARVMSGTRF